MSESRFRAWGWAFLSLFFLLVLAGILVHASSPGLMADDSGETVAAAVCLGVPHPPGYPLYQLIARLFALLPVGTPAFRLNLLSGFFTLAALACLGLAFRALRRRWAPGMPAFMSVLLISGSILSLFSLSSVFAQSLTAKGGIYTLTLLIATILLSWRLDDRETAAPGERRRDLILLLFIWAVGFGNHWETQILWIPFLWQWVRGWNVRFSTSTLLMAASFLVTAGSVYLLLPIRSSWFPDIDWGHPVRWDRFLWVLGRGPYVGIESEARPLSSFAEKGMEALRTVGLQAWPGWFAAALAGWFWLRRKEASIANGLGLFYLPVVLAVVVVPNLTKNTYDLIPIYLVSSQAVPALTAGLGLAAACLAAGRWRPWAGMAVAVCVFLVPAFWTVRTLQKEDRVDYRLADDFGVNLLQGLSKDALVLSEGDQFVMTLFYHRTARNLRRDVTHVPVVFLNTDWGMERALRDLGGRVRNDFPLPDARARLTFLLTAAPASVEGPSLRTFYSLNRGLLDSFSLGLDDRLMPVGLLYESVPGRVLTSQQAATRVWENARFQRWRGLAPLRNASAFSGPDGEFYRYYANQFVVAGNTLNHAGDLAAALEYYLRALEIHPYAAEAYSNMAALYGKEGFLEMAQTLCAMATEKDPDYAGAYDNLGNVLSLMGSYQYAVDAYERALTLKPGSPDTLKNLEMARMRLEARAPMPPWTKRNSPFYFAMGNRYAGEGRLLMAEIAYRTAERVGYTYPDLYNNLGVVLAQLGREEEAEKAFRRGIERSDRFVETYKNYGLLLVNQRRWRDARRWVDRGLALAPDHPELRLLRERIERRD